MILLAVATVATALAGTPAQDRCAQPGYADDLLVFTYEVTPKPSYAWEDKEAAKREGLSEPDYLLHRMPPFFKERLCRLLAALKSYEPGFTSLYRSEWRQAKAKGFHAKPGHSYHQLGLAADIVSLNGRDQDMYRAIDTIGKEADIGIGRPYNLCVQDPDHIGPREYGEFERHHDKPCRHRRARRVARHGHRRHVAWR